MVWLNKNKNWMSALIASCMIRHQHTKDQLPHSRSVQNKPSNTLNFNNKSYWFVSPENCYCFTVVGSLAKRTSRVPLTLSWWLIFLVWLLNVALVVTAKSMTESLCVVTLLNKFSCVPGVKECHASYIWI